MYRNTRSNPKILTTDQVAEIIPSGSRIFLHTGVCFPTALVKPLQKRARNGDVSDLEFYYGDVITHGVIAEPELFEDLHFTLFNAAKSTRDPIQSGKADFVPIFLSEIPSLFKNNVIDLDYAFIQLSPPNQHGYCTLGPSVDFTRAACQNANKIFGLINKTMPIVYGGGIVHISQLDGVIYDDTPIQHVMYPEPTTIDLKIARFVAENLIDNGATVQFGVGQIINSVAFLLQGHKDLGIHSELITDGIVDLMQSGVCTNGKKVVDQGKTSAALSIGSEKLYNYINDNSSVVLREIDFINDFRVIGKNPKVTCVNSCTQIDLTGQIVADSVGTRIISGVGGQLDFITAACRANDSLGKPIIILHSQNKEGRSKILPVIDKGSGVVTTRPHARYVVTEYGIADLFGKTLLQRAHELIKIAHPDCRKDLEAAAFERYKEMPHP